MAARIVSIDPAAPDARVIADAARVLREGGLVAFPTETVYGLGARALDEAALARVFAAKGRPSTHPLIAHVEDENGARLLAATWSALASRLARKFWPGPLTLVVPKAAHVPLALTGGSDSIAVRAPSHPVARALIAALGEPVAAPSANRYQEVSATTAAHVAKSLGDVVDLILDGGDGSACERGIESTVVDVRGDRVVVLRPGPIDRDALRAVEPEVTRAKPIVLAAGAPRASPGLDDRHYAPRARIVLAATRPEAEQSACGLAASGVRVGLLVRGLREPDFASALGRGDRLVLRALPRDAAGYARGFYAALHDLDDAAVDAIVLEAVPDDEAWWAVADRVRRAAGPQAVPVRSSAPLASKAPVIAKKE
jgi:L-threonylcarbamoyladenylate synthase